MATPQHIGPFEIVKVLGAGGMGEVFLARDPKLDRPVAIKRLLSARSTHLERFRREAKITARLDHPAIVRIHGMLEDDGDQCIVMEYVAGKNLRDLLKVDSLSIAQSVTLAIPIAQALAAAHDHQIVHRDLKCENVLVTRAGDVKVTDFGIAKMLDEQTLTAEGAVLGTARAMSPEQVQGRRVDHRSDVFSFGTLLYELLSGQSPFQGATSYETFRRIIEAQPEPIADLVADVPADLSGLLDRLLAKAPEDRPGDFHEIAHALCDMRDALAAAGEDGRLSSDLLLQALEDACAPGDAVNDAGDGGDELPALDRDVGVASTASQRQERAGRQRPTDRPDGMLVPGDPGTIDLGPQSDMFDSFVPVESERVDGRDEAPGRPDDDADGALADELLERPQERAPASRRRGRVIIGAVALAALAGAAALASLVAQSQSATEVVGPEPLRVAILEPTGAGPLRHQLLLRALVRDELARAVSSATDVEIVPHYLVDQAWDGLVHNGETPGYSQLREQLHADELLKIDLTCVSVGNCSFVARKMSASDGDRSDVIVGQIDLADNLEDASVTFDEDALTSHFGERRRDPAVESWLVTTSDRLRLARLKRDFWDVHKKRNYQLTLDQSRELGEGNEGFQQRDAFEMIVWRERYFAQNDESYLSQARNTLDRARKAAPGSAFLRDQELMLALAAGDPSEKTRPIVDQMTENHPGSRWTHAALGRWNIHYNKDRKTARQHYLKAFARVPSVYMLIQLAYLAMRADAEGEAGSLLTRLQEMAPNHFEVQFLNVKMESTYGDLRCAYQLLQDMTSNIRSYRTFSEQAVIQQLLGLYLPAAQSYGGSLHFSPHLADDLSYKFNLAELSHANGENDKALAEFKDIHDQLIKLDNDTRLYEILDGLTSAHIVKLDESSNLRERARQRAAQIANEAEQDKDMLYHAATIHALLGNAARASELMDQLLQQRTAREMFRYSWFSIIPGHSKLVSELKSQTMRANCSH